MGPISGRVQGAEATSIQDEDRSEALLRVEGGELLASVLEEVGVGSEGCVGGYWYSFTEASTIASHSTPRTQKGLSHRPVMDFSSFYHGRFF